MDRRTFLKMTIASTTASAAILRDESIAHTNGHSKSLIDDASYWASIRDEFPISHGELIYMNNGTMGPSPRVVTERVTKRIEHVDSTGDYGGDYEAIRKALARVVNAESGDRIAFTHNVSEAISIVASGIELKAGDEVILTDQEHAGNAIPWLARKKRDGIEIKFVHVTDGEAQLPASDDDILQRFRDAITPRTRAMSVPHLTCTTGHLLPIKRLAAMAREKGIWFLADGAHPPGMLKTDVQDLGVHAYASCGHKWLCGPKGIGFLYISPDFQEHVIPTWTGGEADKYWGYDGKLDFLDTASRYDFATQNFALFDGLLGAIEYQDKIGINKIEQRVKHLTTVLRDGLNDLNNGRFHFLTPAASVTGLTTIKLEKMDCQEFANALMAKAKIRTRVVHESKLNANRLSVHIYTSEDDIRKFLEGVKSVLA
jgi:selenocysteine lyase/cysteine desulfurase